MKTKIKNSLLFKIISLKKEIKAYKNRIINDTLNEQNYIDKINLLENDIRELLLKLSKEDRELWLKERNKNERHTPKKK